MTKGIRPAALLGAVATTPKAIRVATAKPSPAPVIEQSTVEIIRGDKRAREVVRQE